MSRRFIILIVGLFIIQITSSAQIKEQILKFSEVFDKISRFYVDPINEDSFVNKVITDMLHQLDPHSAYLTKDEVKAMQEPLDGSFEGIGVTFNLMNDTIYVISTITGGPSEKVGIMAGDRIIKINEENVAGIGITNLDVQKKLKGPKGSRVNVSILRRNMDELLDFVIVRDKIPIYSVDAKYMINDNTGYIKLSRFSASTMEEFMEALNILKKMNMENLILDLCGNGGGYLKVAVDLADQYMEGKKMIVYTEGQKNPRRNYLSSGKGEMKSGRLVIMIDESSASASEIVAGALQDWDRAVIVGRRSFGKGLVQQPFMLSDGSMVRLTVAKYYTPTGRLIQKSYDQGYEEYTKEVITRFNNGELSQEDSHIFPDSLQYRTLNKNRIVYGGGGIMPDYFVPIDTSYYSPYYRKLISRGILNQFVLKYIDENRKSLQSAFSNFDEFNQDYKVSDEIIKRLIQYAENEDLEYNEEDFARSFKMIATLIKAYIARDLWDTSNFYQIINESDPIFKRAVQIVNDSELYAAKLTVYSDD